MKYKILTLGCKVNRYESEAIATILKRNGMVATEKGETADVFILNSCTVTSTGDQKVRQSLRREKAKNPDAVIVLTGCMAQAFPEKSSELEEADIILGTSNRSRIIEHIMQFISHKQRIIDITKHENGEKFEKMEIDDFSDRTRAYIKIQDGCNRFCSYCIIPYARGRVRSKPLEDLRLELEKIAQKGYKEVVLTGINLSCYGQDLGLGICDAIECANNVEKLERIRLGSLEPELLTIDVINRMKKSQKLCPQFHLSLQSGSDGTLQRMNRHYDTAEYHEIVQNLRNTFENCAITTDIMVGFPGETDKEFEENLNFAKKVKFAQAHVFAYSIRPGTKAAVMENQITKKVKEDRSHQMIKATDATRSAYFDEMIGKTFDVLFEREISKNVFEGYTNNYVPVICSSGTNIKGEILKAVLDYHDDKACFGKIIIK